MQKLFWYMYLLPNCLSWNVLWKLELLTFSRELYVYDNSLANVWMRKVVLLMSICPQDLNFGINLFCHDETFTKIKPMAILNFKIEVYWRKTNRTTDFKTTLPFFKIRLVHTTYPWRNCTTIGYWDHHAYSTNTLCTTHILYNIVHI